MDSEAMGLLRRTLPMLIRLGDFIGNGDVDPNRPGSLGARCDLILDIRAKLAEAGCEVVAATDRRLVYINVNEDGAAYGSHDTLAEAAKALTEFPEDHVVVADPRSGIARGLLDGYNDDDLPTRHCLRCKKDLADVMGVYVFVDGKPRDDALLCVEHGGNGANMLSQSQYDYLTKTPNQRRLYLAGEGDD